MPVSLCQLLAKRSSGTYDTDESMIAYKLDLDMQSSYFLPTVSWEITKSTRLGMSLRHKYLQDYFKKVLNC